MLYLSDDNADDIIVSFFMRDKNYKVAALENPIDFTFSYTSRDSDIYLHLFVNIGRTISSAFWFFKLTLTEPQLLLLSNSTYYVILYPSIAPPATKEETYPGSVFTEANNRSLAVYEFKGVNTSNVFSLPSNVSGNFDVNIVGVYIGDDGREYRLSYYVYHKDIESYTMNFVIYIFIGVVVIALIVLVVICCCRRRKARKELSVSINDEKEEKIVVKE